MEPPKKPPKPRLPGIGGNPFLMKIVFFLGGGVVVMIIVAVVVNMMFGSKTNIQDIVDIATVEQEIVRISAKGDNATTQHVKNAAINTQASVVTQQQEWIKFLAKHGRKVDAKQLVLKKDPKTDVRLTQAQATSTYDVTLTQIMRTQLEAYAKQLKTAYTNATGTEEKKTLQKDYDAVVLLLEQWPADPSTPVSP
jgi:hypothetical protein